MQKLFTLALAFAFIGLSACDTNSVDDTFTVTAAVQADTDLSTLEAAVIQANLAAALDDQDGEFTVFAPTEAAFADALAALDITAAELLANPELAAILQLHVIADEDLDSGDLDDGDTFTTLNGQTLTVVEVGGRIGLDTEDAGSEPNAFVSTADIEVSNGIVHKIDFVLLPN